MGCALSTQCQLSFILTILSNCILFYVKEFDLRSGIHHSLDEGSKYQSGIILFHSKAAIYSDYLHFYILLCMIKNRPLSPSFLQFCCQ